MKENPKYDLETVKDLQLEGVNFSISNKRLLNCKFISCNIIYSGGPFHLDGCEFGHCMFVRIGPLEDAFNNMDGEKIKENLLNSWNDLKIFWEPKGGVDDKGNINLGKTNK